MSRLYRKIRITFFSFFLILNCIQPLFAQESPWIKTELDSLYRSRNYSALEDLIHSSFSSDDSLSDYDKAELHKYLGIVYLIKGRDSDGKQEFVSWLNLDPKGYIDSFRFPPKIVRTYNEAKSEIRTILQIKTAPSEVRWEPSASSILKSFIIPGWGQIEQGKTKRGIYVFAAQSASIAGWLICEHNFSMADKAYHLETDPEKFDPKYDLANNWNKARWSFIVSSVAVYIFAQTDFILFPPYLSPSHGLDDTSSFNSTELPFSTDAFQEIVTFTVKF